MKKALSLLLSALILLSALPALAQGYTLDEKLSKQVKDGSGLRMNISFEKPAAPSPCLTPPATRPSPSSPRAPACPFAI